MILKQVLSMMTTTKIKADGPGLKVTPTLENEDGRDFASWIVEANGNHLGNIWFDPDSARYFHIEPKPGIDDTKRKYARSFSAALMSLIKTRFPGDYQLALAALRG